MIATTPTTTIAVIGIRNGPKLVIDRMHRLLTVPVSILVELTGIEPVTPCLQSRCSPS